MYGAIDLSGNETVPFQYSTDNAYSYGTFLRIDNGDGTYSVVSACVSKLLSGRLK